MLTNSTPYTFVREGYFYYSRRVPSDLTDHYSYPRIVKALRTRSPQKARMLSVTASSQLETYWTQLRLLRGDVFGSNLVKPQDGSVRGASRNAISIHALILS